MQPFTIRDRNRILASLFAAQSLFSSATIAAFTLMAVIAADLSGTDSSAGFPSTVLTFSRALFAFPLGVLMARYGRRNGLTFAYFTGAVAGLIGAFAIVQESFLLLLGAAAVLGLARGGADQSRFTAAEVFPPDQRARVIGLIVFAGTIGGVGGPLLVDPAGRFVHQQFGLSEYTGAWFATAILTALATLVVFLFMRPEPDLIGEAMTPPSNSLPMHGEGRGGVRPLREIFRNPQVQFAVATIVIAQTVMQMLMVITSLYMKHHDHSNADISIVITAHTLGMFGLSAVSGWLIDRFGRFNVILTGAVMLLASCLLAPLSTATGMLVLALFLLGLGWNFCYVGGSSLLSVSLAPAERGSAQGANEALVAFCAGVGTLLTGPIFEAGDYVAVSAAGFVLVLILTGMIGRFSTQDAVELKSAEII